MRFYGMRLKDVMMMTIDEFLFCHSEIVNIMHLEAGQKPESQEALSGEQGAMVASAMFGRK